MSKPLTPEGKVNLKSGIAVIVAYIALHTGKTVEAIFDELKEAVNLVDTTQPISEFDLAKAIIKVLGSVSETTDTEVDDEIVGLLLQGEEIAEGKQPVLGGIKLFIKAIHLIKTGKAEAAEAKAETPAAEAAPATEEKPAGTGDTGDEQ